LSSIFLTEALYLGFIYFSFFLTTIKTFGGRLALFLENFNCLGFIPSSLFFLLLLCFLTIALGPSFLGTGAGSSLTLGSAIDRDFLYECVVAEGCNPSTKLAPADNELKAF
jgi:hypothetical protein